LKKLAKQAFSKFICTTQILNRLYVVNLINIWQSKY